MGDSNGAPPAEPKQQGVKRRQRTFWHYPYADLVMSRRPPGWEVVVEKILSLQPRVADMLLLRHPGGERRDEEAGVMRGLWRHLTSTVLLEFKGPTAGLRQRDLANLLSYGAEYLAEDECPIVRLDELSLVLVVPRETPTLWRELDHCSLKPQPLKDGYVRLLGMPYTVLVVLLDQVADAERDDYLRLFTAKFEHIRDHEALAWAQSWLKTDRKDMEHLKHLEGYEDLVRDFAKHFGKQAVLDHMTPEERLAGLEPEQILAGLSPAQVLAGFEPAERLAGLDPEERLAGLDPEERLAGLDPEERLAGLEPEQILAGLSPEVREQLLAAMTSKPSGDDGER